MSRFVKEKDGLEIAYGFDAACGYFFQVFGEDIEGEENLILDECSLFTKMSKNKMFDLMTEYEVDKDHRDLVALDLPF